MADIDKPIKFTSEFTQRISQKLSDPTFKIEDWSHEDLKDIRKFIRDYYRDLTKKCSYCRKEISLQSANNCHIEHIIPKSSNKKFMFEPKNLCVICSDCNEIKKNKEVEGNIDKVISNNKAYKQYPRSKDSFLIVHPHFDNYDEHIFHCDDIYIDLTPKGTYTMYICKLNRKIHKYGIEPIALSQSELFDLFNKIMSEKNFTKQSILLNKLRSYFIKAS
ncbi:MULTISPECIES: HNH endonuclease [unclassified Chryseobacterium]|uniref:HNH endonuclease n=1 Tax=unclassified Chryseobacterium TaxID=2593645 RepID=UPI002269E930|nr:MULTISPECIES: HNH endonuclease [unclassified Chryseobacterium]